MLVFNKSEMDTSSVNKERVNSVNNYKYMRLYYRIFLIKDQIEKKINIKEQFNNFAKNILKGRRPKKRVHVDKENPSSLISQKEGSK